MVHRARLSSSLLGIGLSLIFGLVTPQPLSAWPPQVTTTVAINSGFKTYNYAIDNTLGDLYSFSIHMPEAGARSIVGYGFSGDNVGWELSPSSASLDIYGGVLQPGGTLQVWLRTPEAVPTLSIGAFSYATQERTYTAADYGLPVPAGEAVPEPSGFLALLVCISGTGGIWLRRKKTAAF